MWYVYYRHMPSGKEDLVGVYYTTEDAIHKITQCYLIDKNSSCDGEYYYFMRKREG